MADEAPHQRAVDLNDLVAFVGAVLVITGVAMIYVPAALIVGGASMLAVALGNVRG